MNFNPEQVTNDCVHCNGDHELKARHWAESGYAIIRCEQVDIIISYTRYLVVLSKSIDTNERRGILQIHIYTLDTIPLTHEAAIILHSF